MTCQLATNRQRPNDTYGVCFTHFVVYEEQPLLAVATGKQLIDISVANFVVNEEQLFFFQTGKQLIGLFCFVCVSHSMFRIVTVDTRSS
jgi:hypothetical protein